MSKNYVARMNSGTVTQIIVGDYDWAVAHLAGEWHDLGGEPLTVAIGYIWNGTEFTTPQADDDSVA